MKILNLYAGIGGNRKLWGDEHEITAVEYDEPTAEVYRDYYPGDKVIVTDAHAYLLANYKNFDFIWSSPPCPSHSDIRRMAVHHGSYDAIYPDMSLYQEILLLKNFVLPNTSFVVENVVPYYYPLVEPNHKYHRHLFWCNFFIPKPEKLEGRLEHNNISSGKVVYGRNLKGTAIKDKRKTLRNMVDPELGLHILNCASELKPDMSQMPLFSEAVK